MLFKKAGFSILILTILFLVGCEKTDNETLNACKSSNPVENVVWLKAIKSGMTNCYCERSILQGTYNNQTVFYVLSTDELCDGADRPTLYDCYGKVVRTFTEDDYQEFYEVVKAEQVLYRCKTTK